MKKLLSTALAVSILTTMNIAPALADALPAVGNTALPNLPDGVTNSNVVKDGAHMNITVGGGTQGAVDTIIWKDYNIGKDAQVNYEFTNHHQTSINKVNAAGGLSQIYGKITNSSCYNCGYENTGKIILVNPNGFIFGQNANVDVNSFTVSTLGLTSDQWTEEKRFDKNGNEYTIKVHNIQFDRNGQSQGITIKDNAKIYGDKGVNLISDQIQYTGSKISTNLSPNYVEDTGAHVAYGKVKIFTADGVNFQYGVSGAVQKTDEALIRVSNDKMLIDLQGEIESGNIDIRNYSDNLESSLNLNGATLKATKAINGNNGNIWLLSENTTTINNSEIYTGALAGAQAREGENLLIISKNGANIDNTTVNVGGDIDATSDSSNVVVNASTINSAKDINIKGKNVTIDESKINAVNIADVNADGDTLTMKSAYFNAKKILLHGYKNVTGDADLNNNKAFIDSSININVKLKNVGNRDNGLIAQAGTDMSIETDGDLSISSLISGRNMNLKANKIISGYNKTSNILRDEGDSTDRAYIHVGGEFNSEPGYVVTDSADLTADGLYNQRHHIQYHDGTEKILLVTKLPISGTSDPGSTPPVIIPPIDGGESIPAIDINDDQAAMALKLPQKPQHIANVNNISDGRTTFIDVFAAASQIEVDDEED